MKAEGREVNQEFEEFESNELEIGLLELWVTILVPLTGLHQMNHLRGKDVLN